MKAVTAPTQKGSVFLSILLTIVVLAGVGLVYVYYTQFSSLGPPPIPIVVPTPQAQDETSSWKTYEDTQKEISFKYPPDWYLSSDNQYVSQFPYDPLHHGESGIYNAIHTLKTSDQLQSGYTNEDWLKSINDLKPDEKLTNEFRPSANVQIVKFGSGTTKNGARFVLYKNIALQGNIVAATATSTNVYELILEQSDQAGVDTLLKIMRTFSTTD